MSAPPAFARIADDVRAAIAMIDDAMKRPPLELTHEVDGAERKVVDVRDALIAIVRAGDGRSVRARAALDEVNAALSLLAGVEYPATGVQRSMLQQSLEALRDLLDRRHLAA